MEVIINKSRLGGTIKAIASKSQAHRLLICGALSDAPGHIVCSESSADIDATVNCLTALGARITKTDDGFHVVPIDLENVPAGTPLDCGESGSTLRFMLPIVCALGSESALFASGRLPQRPLSPLYEELSANGCVLSPQGDVPLKCRGRLRSGQYKLSGNVSSQFISGLLFALPLLDGDSELELIGPVESKPYIDMTLSALARYGIKIKREKKHYYIAGCQRYHSPGLVEVEGDWSNAAFWLCAGAISGRDITCENLNLASLQGDKDVTSLLERFGAKITYEYNCVAVSKGSLHGIEIDARDIPDLVPVLAAVASVSKGTTVIKNAQRLRMKESDRLNSVTETLTALGANIRQTRDGLIILGKKALTGGKVDSFGDHRIAMTAAVAACGCDGEVVIKGAQAVSKSYPAFFEDYSSLDGDVQYINSGERVQ